MHHLSAKKVAISKSKGFTKDVIKFSIPGVIKVLMHLLNFLLQHHDDEIFGTYKSLANTDKEAVITPWEQIW